MKEKFKNLNLFENLKFKFSEIILESEFIEK